MCAIFEYQPQNNDEVALSMNEKVEVIEGLKSILFIIL